MAFLHAVLVGFLSIGATIISWFSGTPYDYNNATLPTEAPTVQPAAQSPSMSGMGTSTGGVLPGPASQGTSGSSAAAAAALPAGSPALATLPLGDYKYTTSAAKQGYIYLCHVAAGGEGAQGTPSWIHGTSWTPAQKIAVQGSVSWPSAWVNIVVNGANRLITGNDLPVGATTGTFPIAASDPAHQYDANPNSVEAQSLSFSLPASPTVAATPNCINGEVGIMTNGVLLLDGFDAEYRDAEAHEVQDSCQGHPHESGVYHYHSLSGCIKSPTVSTVIGWAFDGFPITGPILPSDNQLHTADLDICHGITSPVEEDGKMVTTYHYVMTEDFPYSISCFRGKSYEPAPGGSMPGMNMSTSNSGGGAGAGGTPPASAISACVGLASGAACTVGLGSGTCRTTPDGSFACIPN